MEFNWFLMTSSLVAFLLGLSQSFDLAIMHTNDVHARFQEVTKYGSTCRDTDSEAGACFGGVARRMTKIKEIRAKYPNNLLLDGGDQFQGSPWFYYYKGSAASRFMEIMGYDAMTIGNHEFDLGVSGLVHFLSNVTFPVVSCNIDASDEPSLSGLFRKSTILTVAGERIGIVGYTFHGTPELSKTENVIFHDEIPYIQMEVDRMLGMGINKIFGVGHAGYDVDMEIAKQVRGIDVIIGGHTDTFLFTGTPPTDDKVFGPYPTVINPPGTQDGPVLVVQSFTWGKYLGFLDVTFDDAGRITRYSGNPITLNSSVVKDPDMLHTVQNLAKPMTDSIGDVIGDTYVFLDGTRLSCRTRECNLGNIVTDAMLKDQVTFRLDEPQRWSDVSIAMINSGAMRASIPQGQVTMGDIYAVLPFLNTNDVIELQGKYLLHALEHSVANYDPIVQPGRFLQVSGLIITYDISRPVGSRVVSVEVRCSECTVPDYEPLDLDKVYRIVIPTYIADGGDGYTMIAENKRSHLSGNLDAAGLINYIKAHEPIIDGIERRINFVEAEEPSAASRASAWTALITLCTFMMLMRGWW